MAPSYKIGGQPRYGWVVVTDLRSRNPNVAHFSPAVLPGFSTSRGSD
jgi:hypothetical protein